MISLNGHTALVFVRCACARLKFNAGDTGSAGARCSSFVSSTVLLIKLQLAVLDLWLQSGQHKVVAIAGLADLLCRRLMAWDGRVANPFQNTFAAAEDDPSPSPTATMQVLSARTMLQKFIQPVTAEQNHCSLVKILENLNCSLQARESSMGQKTNSKCLPQC